MIIRNYNKTDINKISSLGSLLHDNYKFILDGFSKCLVIEEDDNLIGYVIYSIIYERAEIVDIVIDPLYRNNKYGYKLLSNCIDDIMLSKAINITLEVNENNEPAIRLYQKLGFEICAIRKNYYDNYDGYLMKKDLR